MLNIKLGDAVHKGIRDLVHTLSVGHISEYPIDVVVRPDHANRHTITDVYFLDSRFPIKNDDWGLDKIIACFFYNGDYVLKSYRIQNNKYNPFSDGYRTRKTADTKKMLRVLSSTISTLSNTEIVAMVENLDTPVRSWEAAPEQNFYDLTSELHSNEIVNEVLHLKTLGVQFRSDKFKRVAEQAEELRTEGKRRKQFVNTVLNLYVYEQPDGLVSVTFLGETKDKVYRGTQSWTYENIDATPEVIRQQLALLKLSEVNNYIPEVGKRDQNGYWIHVTPDKFSLPS